MLFVFIYLYWCPTRFLYQMMFVLFNSNTPGATYEHLALSSPPIFSPIRVVQCQVFCVMFSISFCSFSIGYCITYTSMIYGIWLSLWYLQTFFSIVDVIDGINKYWAGCRELSDPTENKDLHWSLSLTCYITNVERIVKTWNHISDLFYLNLKWLVSLRRVWRYQRGNQNPYIEEEQTTQWPSGKGQKDKQRSTKHTYKTTDRVTRTPLKIGGELRCSGMVSSSCYTSGTRRVNLVTNPVISQYIFKTGRCWTMTHLWLVYQLYVFQHWLHYLG
jgi:hypothetical protein